MEQLELRFYTRQEIAATLDLNVRDSGHFKRNVETTLSKWGYGFEYSRSGITITSRPETAESRLKEILIRELKLDVQINPYHFSCFMTAFSDVDGFDSMPWGERESTLSKIYGVAVSERTLRNWCAKLIARNMICKGPDKTFWKTEIFEGVKYRSQVTAENQEEMSAYFARRRELIAAEHQKAQETGLSAKEAKQQAWKQAYKQLWTEFQCCYYSCKGFQFGAFSDLEQQTMYEIFELTRELAGIDLKRA